MKLLIITISVLTILIVTYLLGPEVEPPQLNGGLPKVPTDLDEIEQYIFENTDIDNNIKPGNESQLIWADSIKQKTKYAVVYLHGFSASPEEGAPTHREFAKRYGCNLYIPRLDQHGLIESETMLNFTAEGYIQSAKEAIAIGNQLGDSLIVMSCSTGSTAALYLASVFPEIHSLILYSPNIDLFDSRSAVITMPWGLQLMRMINGGDYHTWKASEEAQKYWHTSYRIESTVQLKAMVEATMIEETFNKINQPIFMGYYYKNEEEQDYAVSVPRMLEMFDQLGTSSDKKVKQAFPDAATHGIQNHFFSKDYEGVLRETINFADQILHLPIPVNSGIKLTKQ